MARGQQKIQSQQKAAERNAKAKKQAGHSANDQKKSAAVALKTTCSVCRVCNFYEKSIIGKIANNTFHFLFLGSNAWPQDLQTTFRKQTFETAFARRTETSRSKNIEECDDADLLLLGNQFSPHLSCSQNIHLKTFSHFDKKAFFFLWFIIFHPFLNSNLCWRSTRNTDFFYLQHILFLWRISFLTLFTRFL